MKESSFTESLSVTTFTNSERATLGKQHIRDVINIKCKKCIHNKNLNITGPCTYLRGNRIAEHNLLCTGYRNSCRLIFHPAEKQNKTCDTLKG